MSHPADDVEPERSIMLSLVKTKHVFDGPSESGADHYAVLPYIGTELTNAEVIACHVALANIIQVQLARADPGTRDAMRRMLSDAGLIEARLVPIKQEPMQ